MALQTEKNTKTVEKRIRSAAWNILRKRNLHTFFEHGQWWVEHRPSGAQWSAVDCNNAYGFDFEQVTEGDED